MVDFHIFQCHVSFRGVNLDQKTQPVHVCFEVPMPQKHTGGSFERAYGSSTTLNHHEVDLGKKKTSNKTPPERLTSCPLKINFLLGWKLYVFLLK